MQFGQTGCGNRRSGERCRRVKGRSVCAGYSAKENPRADGTTGRACYCSCDSFLLVDPEDGSAELEYPMKKLLHKCLLVPLGHILPVLVAVSPAFAAEQANHRPNLVYIFTDQQWAGAMSCAGNSDLSTPALDGLASRGVRFHNAYCTQPLCVPSRTAMMTGVYPHEIGATHNTFAWDRAPVPILGKVLVQSGYECAWFGKWHLPTSRSTVLRRLSCTRVRPTTPHKRKFREKAGVLTSRTSVQSPRGRWCPFTPPEARMPTSSAVSARS